MLLPLLNCLSSFHCAWQVVKYPPSICYTLLTLGIDFTAITFCCELDRWHRRRHDRAHRRLSCAATAASAEGAAQEEPILCAPFSWALWHPFLMLGRSPLFFYLLHIWMLAICGIVIGGRTGAGFFVSYPVWIAVVAVLVPLCARYAHFKQSKPVTSLWRLF